MGDNEVWIKETLEDLYFLKSRIYNYDIKTNYILEENNFIEFMRCVKTLSNMIALLSQFMGNPDSLDEISYRGAQGGRCLKADIMQFRGSCYHLLDLLEQSLST